MLQRNTTKTSTLSALFQRERLATRMLAAWITVAFADSMYADSFLTLEFCSITTLPAFLLKWICTLALFSILQMLWTRNLDIMFLFGATILYSIRVCQNDSSPYLLAGICLFNAILLWYYRDCIWQLGATQSVAKILQNKTCWTLAILLFALGIFFYLTISTIFRYEMGRSSTFDFGIFVQMFYNMKEHFSMVTTCERNELLSHMNVHISPFYYLLLPIYALIPSPKTLLTLQAAAVLVGFYPLVKLLKRYAFSFGERMLFCVIYGCSPAILGGCFYDFHENVFLIPLLLFLLYCCEEGYVWRTLLCTILVCSVKEDATLFALAIGAYLLISKKNLTLSLPILGISGLWMICALRYLSLHGQGLMDIHYRNLVSPGYEGALGILHTLVSNPAYLFTQIFNADNMEFLLAVFIPLTILPFYTKKISRYILMIPFVFVNLLPDYVYQHSVFYQYVFAPFTLILYLAIQNVAEFQPQKKKLFLLCGCLFSVLAFTSLITNKNYYLDSYSDSEKERMAILEMTEQIPENASVSASTFFVPHLASRDTIFMIDQTIVEQQTIFETDYAVFDLRSGMASDTVLEQIQCYENAGYQEVSEKPNQYLILKRP